MDWAIPVMSNMITIRKPYCSIFSKEIACFVGSMPVRTLPPSSGGTGIILNTASTILYKALNRNISKSGDKTTRLITSGAMIDKGIMNILMTNTLPRARSIFVAGPAAAESAISRLGLLKFMGLIGTGFAYPKTNCPCVEMSRSAGRSTVPIRSMCAIGFRVSLPSIFAVGSPSLYATNPCATSWNVIAIRIGTAAIIIFSIREEESKTI
jgi:hypothetical protein